MLQELLEATLGQLKNKQRSITRLFPDFFSNPDKVRGVISKGGVRLRNIEKDKWTFKVHSGTKEDVWYDVVVRWKDLEKSVEDLVSDRRNWTKNKKRADLKKIASKLFNEGDVELSCDCDAEKYWGPAYQLTQRHAKYGEPEERSPDIRNPKQYGQYCKHIQVLMRTLPFYQTTIANWLGKEFKDLIQRTEGSAIQTTQKYRAAGRELGQRLARESVRVDSGDEISLQKAQEKYWHKNLTSNYPNIQFAGRFHGPRDPYSQEWRLAQKLAQRFVGDAEFFVDVQANTGTVYGSLVRPDGSKFDVRIADHPRMFSVEEFIRYVEQHPEMWYGGSDEEGLRYAKQFL